jgi:hypothetical protein
MRITAACPQALIADANQLAMVLCYGPADALTYGEPNWQDAAGNLYSCASFVAPKNLVERLQGELQRPQWDVFGATTDEEGVVHPGGGGIIDMDAARRAQAALLYSLEPVAAMPNKLTACPGADGLAVLAAMGLVRIELEDPSTGTQND